MSSRRRLLVPMLMGFLLIGGGLAIIGVSVIQKLSSNQFASTLDANSDTRINSWIKGAPAPGAPDAPKTCAESSAANDYALVKFTGVPYASYIDVAVDGNWDNLHTSSMVHWHGSADPGGQGNVIIAFHREPKFEHIDQLNTGGTITIQDRACHTYVYTVTTQWQGDPSRVTQLVTTQSGHTLTMITCTPWWQDYNRIVWSANLTSVDGKPFTG